MISLLNPQGPSANHDHMHIITSHKVSGLICTANLLSINVPLGFILSYVVCRLVIIQPSTKKDKNCG